MFYSTGKPFTRWWWFACEIRREDITAQLEWLRDNGFGGVEIAWVFKPRGTEPWKRVFPDIDPAEEAKRRKAAVWLSPEWIDDVVFAKTEADRLGLGCDFTFGTLWPFGDTKVSDDDASRQIEVDEHGQISFEAQKLRLSWEDPLVGNVINHLDKSAFERYADRMGTALQPALAGTKSGLFCESWEVHSEALWTPGFEEIFGKKYGYDISPYISGMWAPGSDPDIRYDYLTLISELVVENFYKPFAEHISQLGGFSRAQVAGAPVDMLLAYSLLDVPETEAMLFEPAFGRIVSSAAALGGRKDVSAEAFTCIYGFPGWVPDTHQFEEKAGDLKLVADALFAHGVNHIIWHGTPFTPKGAEGDFRFYATVHVGRNEGTLNKDLRPLNAYLELVSSHMKMGRTYSDVAVWLPLEDGRMDRDYPAELVVPGSSHPYEMRYVYPPSEVRGHHPLYVSNSLLQDAEVQVGTVSAGDAVFKALYIDVKYLAIEGLETAVRLAQGGLPVVLKQDPLQPGRNKNPKYSSLIQDLKALGATDDFGSAVHWQPLVKSLDGQPVPDFWARRVKEEILLFFPHPDSQNLRFPLPYDKSSRSKSLERKIEISVAGRRIPVLLAFAAHQSILLRANKNGVQFIDVTCRL